MYYQNGQVFIHPIHVYIEIGIAGWGSQDNPPGSYPGNRWFKSTPRYIAVIKMKLRQSMKLAEVLVAWKHGKMKSEDALNAIWELMENSDDKELRTILDPDFKNFNRTWKRVLYGLWKIMDSQPLSAREMLQTPEFVEVLHKELKKTELLVALNRLLGYNYVKAWRPKVPTHSPIPQKWSINQRGLDMLHFFRFINDEEFETALEKLPIIMEEGRRYSHATYSEIYGSRESSS